MIYRKKRAHSNGVRSGYYRLEGHGKKKIFGWGDGDFLRLRDENGKVWSGTAEAWDQDTVRYRFRDEDGNSVSGISTGSGIVLQDDKGRTWRGLVD